MTRAIRAKLIFFVLIGVLAAAFTGMTVWVIADQQQRNVELTERVVQKNAIIADKDEIIEGLTDDLVASQANATRLYEQILALGATPDGKDPQTVIVEGARGPSGLNGQDATDAQVYAALVRFCLVNTCVQPPPKDGTNGTNGTNGRDGLNGTNGQDGAPGAPGRGIQSTYCDDTTGRWTVTYTDATTADAGVCRTTLIEGVTP